MPERARGRPRCPRSAQALLTVGHGTFAARRGISVAGALLNTGLLPIDLVTNAGSGLDPDISVAAGLYQAPRVAGARGLPVETVRRLVAQHSEGRQFGILGEPRVHVLELNRALDTLR